tara:strand:+ start:133 stop:426 length:294 start_codon:yes stop_codon:yes gene_type:complete
MPILRRPDGNAIRESLTTMVHLFEEFFQLALQIGGVARAQYSRHLAILATRIYPAYRRQTGNRFTHLSLRIWLGSYVQMRHARREPISFMMINFPYD